MFRITSPAESNDLRSTVGALTAIRQLQNDYYNKVLPRDACIANATLMLGFGKDEAGELFPEQKPDAPTTGPAQPARAPFPQGNQSPPTGGGKEAA